jgi:hypothetical protein
MSWANASQWVMLILQSCAATGEVYLHRGFGERYLSISGVVGVGVVLFFSLFWPGHNLQPLMIFLGIYVVLCVRARVECLCRRWRGDAPHSYYNGLPRMMRLLPTWDEVTVKRFVEPLTTFLIGACWLPQNQPLGFYLMITAFCMAATNTAFDGWNRVQALDMNDAVVRQQQIAERFRKLRGESS